MTTDTHIVNTVEAVNQVGGAIPDDELIALIDELVDAAIDDLEPVEAGMASETAEVTVFGNDRTEMLASTANAVVSLGGALAAAFIIRGVRRERPHLLPGRGVVSLTTGQFLK